jgi:hypothetical protein
MKNLIFGTSLVVFLIALTTTSCKKDTNEPFIGKWEIQLAHIVYSVDDSILGDTTFYFDPGDTWIQFNDDNTGYVNHPGYKGNFNWSVDGDVITIVFTHIGQANTYLYYAVSETIMTWYTPMNEGPWIPDPSKTYHEVWYHWAKRI